MQGRYQLMQVLGRGSVGTVWQAEDQLMERMVALKEIAHPAETGRGRRKAAEHLMAEVRAVARLRHPGLVTIYDVLIHKGHTWIAMEYLGEGSSLADEVFRNGRLPWRQVAATGAQVAAAVGTAHQAGVLHGCLRPSKVFLADGLAVVTGYGITTAFLRASARPGTVVGVPGFIAPEILDGQSPGPEADMWSLGVTLYYAAEGRLPFEGETPKALIEATLAHSLAPAEHAGPLGELLPALLSKDPRQRPDAAAACQALASHREIGPGTAGSATPAEPSDQSTPGPRFYSAEGVQVGSGNVQYNYFYGTVLRADSGGAPDTPERGTASPPE